MKKISSLPSFFIVINALWVVIILMVNLQIPSAQAEGNPQKTLTPVAPSPTPAATSETEIETGVEAGIETENEIQLYSAPLALHPNDHFYFTRPLSGNVDAWESSYYRYGVIKDDPDSAHTGLDIRLEVGTPVYAAASGTVVWAGYGLYLSGQDSSGPYGLAIVIRHDFGYQGQTLYTVYGHLSHIGVRRGQKVEAEQWIAYTGNTGISSAPHLHYEVRLGENDFFSSVNPELWTVPPEGTGLLIGRMTTTAGKKLLGQEIAILNIETGITLYSQSYASEEAVGSDPYYDENIVFSDLPPGEYRIYVPFGGYSFYDWVTVHPGTITFFNFKGFFGLTSELPEIQIPGNLPIYEIKNQ